LGFRDVTALLRGVFAPIHTDLFNKSDQVLFIFGPLVQKNQSEKKLHLWRLVVIKREVARSASGVKATDMSVARIFQSGCRDVSTKESRALMEVERLSTVRTMNPNVVVLNKRGKKLTTPVSKKVSSAPVCKRLPQGFIASKLKLLQEGGIREKGDCKHDPACVYSSIKLVYGDVGDSQARVAKEYVVYENTVVAASSGYYLVAGEMVYLHSDGSICRISFGENKRCSCNRFH
jgi:hypothetical protein